MAMDRRKYPPDWKSRSKRFRFEVADGICQWCGIKHGTVEAKGPDLHSEYPATRISFVWINAAHRDHTTLNSDDHDLIALCPRCHAFYDMADIQAKKEYGLNHAGDHQFKLFRC